MISFRTLQSIRIYLDSDLLSKAGAEVFWKIDSSKQVNLTLNPDFGQVESDEVVVNFSAFETFTQIGDLSLLKIIICSTSVIICIG